MGTVNTESDAGAFATDDRRWVRRHVVALCVWSVVLLLICGGVVVVKRAADRALDSYAIHYGKAIEPAAYASITRAVVSRTGSDHVLEFSIEHTERGDGSSHVPVVTYAVTTAPDRTHPLGALWVWRAGALVLTAPLTRTDPLAGIEPFTLSALRPAALNAVDRRMRSVLHHGVTSTRLTVHVTDNGPRILARSEQRGSEEYADASARLDGTIVEGSACHAGQHVRGQPLQYRCAPIRS